MDIVQQNRGFCGIRTRSSQQIIHYQVRSCSPANADALRWRDKPRYRLVVLRVGLRIMNTFPREALWSLFLMSLSTEIASVPVTYQWIVQAFTSHVSIYFPLARMSRCTTLYLFTRVYSTTFAIIYSSSYPPPTSQHS